MTKWKIYNQDVIEWAEQYEKGKFHALLTDAPYHLTSIVKRFGKNGSAPAQYGTDGVFSRSSKGFMGTTWDGGDIAFRPETWEALGEHLYPGAFGMAFSASRNWHRMAVAIEDAGFILHPTIFFLWVQGQGFPKATKVRADGFEGYKYGLQALKPAVEPVIIFQKPYEGRPIENITQTGAGVLNIDGGRIGVDGGGTHCNNRDEFGNCLGHNNAGRSTSGQTVHSKIDSIKINRFKNGAKPWGNAKGEEYDTIAASLGRYPANLILDEESARRMDDQTGELRAGVAVNRNRGDRVPSTVNYANHTPEDVGFGDSGGASRFFFRVQEQIDEADPFYYCAKVNPKERNAGLDEKNPHPTLKPIKLTEYLAKLLLPPEQYSPRRILVPFSGAGSEMVGAGLAGWEHIVGIEFDTENGYVEIAEKRLEYYLGNK